MLGFNVCAACFEIAVDDGMCLDCLTEIGNFCKLVTSTKIEFKHLVPEAVYRALVNELDTYKIPIDDTRLISTVDKTDTYTAILHSSVASYEMELHSQETYGPCKADIERMELGLLPANAFERKREWRVMRCRIKILPTL